MKSPTPTFSIQKWVSHQLVYARSATLIQASNPKGNRHSTQMLSTEIQHHPNHSLQADRDPRERGPRPLNSSRYKQ